MCSTGKNMDFVVKWIFLWVLCHLLARWFGANYGSFLSSVSSLTEMFSIIITLNKLVIANIKKLTLIGFLSEHVSWLIVLLPTFKFYWVPLVLKTPVVFIPIALPALILPFCPVICSHTSHCTLLQPSWGLCCGCRVMLRENSFFCLKLRFPSLTCS